MKITFERQTDEQVRDLIVLLLETRAGSVYTGMSARFFFFDTYGLNADWHEYSNALDEMERRGRAEVSGHGPDGMTEYFIRPILG